LGKRALLKVGERLIGRKRACGWGLRRRAGSNFRGDAVKREESVFRELKVLGYRPWCRERWVGDWRRE